MRASPCPASAVIYERIGAPSPVGAAGMAEEPRLGRQSIKGRLHAHDGSISRFMSRLSRLQGPPSSNSHGRQRIKLSARQSRADRRDRAIGWLRHRYSSLDGGMLIQISLNLGGDLGNVG